MHQRPPQPQRDREPARDGRADQPPQQPQDRPPRDNRGPKERPAPLDLAQALPLVERALEVLERRGVQPQLGLLKSTMLQLTPSFNEKAYGAHSFSEFVELLKRGDYVHVTGHGGKYMIERKKLGGNEKPAMKPEDTLPLLRDVLEDHRLDVEEGVPAEQLQQWVADEAPQLDWKAYGFQEFNELLNYAQDRTVVRIEIDEEKGLTVYLGAEFYPPAPPAEPEPEEQPHEYDLRQPVVAGQPSIFEPEPKPVSPRATRKKTGGGGRRAGGGGGDVDGNRAPVKRAPRKKRHD